MRTPPDTDAHDPERLSYALTEMAWRLHQIDIGWDLFCAFTCDEADSIARVLYTAGLATTAIVVIRRHAAGDEPDDTHHHISALHDHAQHAEAAAYLAALADPLYDLPTTRTADPEGRHP